MAEESTTPDLVELGRQAVEATNHGDIDPLLGLYDPDAVYVTEGSWDGSRAEPQYAASSKTPPRVV